MSAPVLKGFSASDVIADGRALRVTFGERHSLTLDALFSRNFSTVSERLAPVARFIPVSLDGRFPVALTGSTTITLDGINKVTRSGAELVNALTTASDSAYVKVKTVELLSAAQKSTITKQTGATDRDKAAADQAAKDEANSITKKLADALGVTAKVAAVIAVAVILVVASLYLPRRS